ncbi:acyl-CoA dehydrogenase [Pseudomonas sp. p106]|jgi:alkylation response protein AidB-like acyl-CoA dehydrogenase|uniref:acyl-CoA dehydrogenase n=1 Tax=Pseudomonas sp. p106 TaxID=2479854 RepID=UPI000E6AC1B3|nr:acyl-CoA dehydrogenase [Pseudomonas sp. p106]QPN46451.1 acyl-CoA dehydrogenase [Priestia aryabhattai]RRV46280.1 acyl-CoA dehydrogenase [Pseudomonas sp. p106]
MAWLQRLNDPFRQPLAGTLGEAYAAQLERLGGCAPFELAVLGGRAMATPGLAFLIGYQAALRMLWPSAPASLGALCATERRSVRPADMQTRLEGLRLTGRKDFVTAGLDAEWLLVAARSEGQGEAPRLSLGVVYPGEPGVTLEALPTLPLMPEVGHGRLQLHQAACELLAGDGWDAYVKPFRSLEDLYVLAAMVAWLYGVAQECGWQQELRLRLIALLAGCAEASRQCADSVGCHLLLAGLFAQFQALKGAIDKALSAGPAQWAQLWQRDQGVMALATAAREKRLAKAWEAAGLS